jgi:hypothetical protein
VGLDRLRPEQTIGDNDFGNLMVQEQNWLILKNGSAVIGLFQECSSATS